MYLYIEKWLAKPAWKGLSSAEKNKYLSQVKPVIRSFIELDGVKLLGLTRNSYAYPKPSEYAYAAIWLMPSVEVCQLMEEAVEELDWHRYFDQINFRGPKIDGEEIMELYMNEA